MLSEEELKLYRGKVARWVVVGGDKKRPGLGWARETASRKFSTTDNYWIRLNQKIWFSISKIQNYKSTYIT